MFKLKSIVYLLVLFLMSGVLHAVDQQDLVTGALKLVDQGQQPRHMVQYRMEKGHTRQMVMWLDMEMKSKVGDMPEKSVPIPTQKMIMTLKVTDTHDNGAMDISFTFDKAAVVTDQPSVISQQIEKSLKTVEGINGTYTISADGKVSEEITHVPDGVDPQIQQTIEQFNNVFSQASCLLPTVPVGKGASWQVDQQVQTPMFPLVNHATYTVEQISEDHVKLQINITQDLGNQDINQNGMKMTIKEFETTGSGTMDLKLTELVPYADMITRNKNKIHVNNNGTQINVTSVVTMKIKIEPLTE